MLPILATEDQTFDSKHVCMFKHSAWPLQGGEECSKLACVDANAGLHCPCGDERYQQLPGAAGKAEEQTEDSMKDRRRNRRYTQMDVIGSCEGPAH